MEEKWVKIEGYEKYFVSDKGRIKSYHSGEGKIMKQHLNNSGYYCLNLSGAGKRANLVHRVIANAFIKNHYPGTRIFVNHRNGIKTDNRITNLEWVTNKENMQHAFKEGLIVSLKGEAIHSTKLTAEIVEKIRRMPSPIPSERLAKEYGVSKSTVEKARNGSTWKHLKIKGSKILKKKGLSEGDVRRIREFTKPVPLTALAKELGVTRSTVWHVYKGKSWKYIERGRSKGRRKKLTEKDVRQIRKMSSSIPSAKIGKEWGVTSGTIWAVRTRRTWKDIKD